MIYLGLRSLSPHSRGKPVYIEAGLFGGVRVDQFLSLTHCVETSEKQAERQSQQYNI